MINFAGVTETMNSYTIDGYSDKKTVNGAIKDFGRFIAKYSKPESENLIQYTQECILSSQKDCDYFFTIEDVPCASNWNEDTETMEYTDGNYYLCMRFIRG